MNNHLNNGLHSLDTLHQLFEVVKRCVWDSGGDGWGCIVTLNPELLADEFEKWESEHGGYWVRHPSNKLSFGQDQEWISFDKTAPESDGFDEIVVIIPWAAG